MHIKLFGKTLLTWLALLLKVSRSDYTLDKHGCLEHSAHWQWNHKEAGLAQRSLLARWWFIHGTRILFKWVHNYARNHGVWGKEYEGPHTTEYELLTKWLGKVDVCICNVLYTDSITFTVLHYEFNICIGVDRPFPEKPIITNLFKKAQSKEVYA